jgi:hypothetical protein
MWMTKIRGAFRHAIYGSFGASPTSMDTDPMVAGFAGMSNF